MKNSTIASYNGMAARYAARPVYPLTREIDRFAALVRPGGRVVDVGCGPGQYARMLAERGFWVVALDLAGGMLTAAKAAGTGRLLQADMRHLPFSAGVADGCFACASLLHLPRVEAPAALVAMRRVLRPGGALYLALKEGDGEAWVEEPEGPRFFAYYRASEVDGLLATEGFRVTDAWISPPGDGQRRRWINCFAVAVT